MGGRRVFPSHSHNQHNRLRSSMSNFIDSPEYVFSVMWFKTAGKVPVSEGESAQVAKA